MTQNSFPSGSAITVHGVASCPTSARRAPRAMSRSTSSSRVESMGVTSQWTGSSKPAPPAPARSPSQAPALRPVRRRRRTHAPGVLRPCPRDDGRETTRAAHAPACPRTLAEDVSPLATNDTGVTRLEWNLTLGATHPSTGPSPVINSRHRGSPASRRLRASSISSMRSVPGCSTQ